MLPGEDCRSIEDSKVTVSINLNNRTAMARSGAREVDRVIAMVAVNPERDMSSGSMVIRATGLMHEGTGYLMPADLMLRFNPNKQLAAHIIVASNGDAPLIDGQDEPTRGELFAAPPIAEEAEGEGEQAPHSPIGG